MIIHTQRVLRHLVVFVWMMQLSSTLLSGQQNLQTDTIGYSILFDEIMVLAPEKELSPLSFQSIVLSESKVSATERIDQYLNFIPGIEMQSGALNTNRIVFRGIGSRSPFATSKLRAYLDDIPLTDGIGETNIEDINMESIASIDLWKGPFRSAYGAGLGGAIKYVTKNIASLDSYFKTENSVGDFGYFRTDNTLSKKINSNSALALNQEYISSSGYRDNNNYKKSFTGATYKLIGKRYTVTALLNHIDLKSQIPSSLNINDYEENPQVAAANWQGVEGYEDYRKTRFGVNYVYLMGDHGSLSSTLYGYDFNSFELRPFNVLDDESRAYSLRNIYTRSGQKSNLEIGHEFYFERYKWQIFDTVEGMQGPKEEEGKSSRKLINLFAEYSHEIINRLTVGTGINLHFNSISIDDVYNNYTTERSYDPLISPRAYIAYTLSENLSSRLDIAHGFSNPGLDESLDAQGRFNESIEQENGWNYDLGLAWKPSEKFNINVSGFLMNVNNIIVNRQDQEGNVFGLNAGKTRHKGLEIQSDYHHSLGQHTKLRIIGSGEIGNYRFLDFIDGGNDYSGNQLTGVAGNKYSIRAALHHHHTSFVFTHRYVSSLPVNDENSVFAKGYNLSGFYFNQDIILDAITLSLSSEIDNISNTKYASMVAVNASAFGNNLPRYYYPGLPLNGKFTIKIKYNFD